LFAKAPQHRCFESLRLSNPEDFGMRGDSQSGRSVKRIDAASYDGAADTFDQLSERLSASIAARLLNLAQIESSSRVLDLGAGTGLLALRAAQVAETGKVVGIDHSASMLRKAKKKAAAQGLNGRVEFRKMDAEALEFGTGSFDIAISLFVLVHLPNPLAAAKELHRVLRPGGRVVVGLGAGPPLASGAGMAHAARRLWDSVSASRGRVITAPSFLRGLMLERGLLAGGQESIKAYTSKHVQAELDARKILREAGFVGIRSSWVGATFNLSVEQFWEVCATFGSPERVRLAQLSAEQSAALKENFMHRASGVLSGGGKLIYRCGARMHAASK